MIDNYEQIKSIMTFSETDWFYYAAVLRRKKDQPEGVQMTSDNRIIKDYFVRSEKDFEDKYEEMKALADVFNGRVYFYPNRCMTEQLASRTLKLIADYLDKKEYHCVAHAYTTTIGRNNFDKDKKWIVDVDVNEGYDGDWIRETVAAAPSKFDNNIILDLPTPNGFHLITHPFDSREVSAKYPSLIHKQNPTLLYRA
jgi:hypothetical protein